MALADITGPRPAGGLRDLAALVRPGQWPKNLVVLVPLLEALQPTVGALTRAALAVALFTIASAMVYVGNDLADAERDRAHPVKRLRPIASGRIGRARAVACLAGLAMLAGLAVAALPIAAAQMPAVVWPVAVYLLINVGYTAGLKHVPLIDVFTVACGFVLRLILGYLVLGRAVQPWLAVCVLGVCLLLVLGKRRHEMHAGGLAHRPALAGYTVAYLDQLLVLCAATTLLSYLLYARSFGVAAMLTAPCALFCLFRYLQIVLVQADGGNPSRLLLRDPMILATGVLWIALFEGGVHG